MSPLFQFVHNSTAYVPWVSVNDDGSPIDADGVRFFDLTQAAARSGHTLEVLLEAWRTTFAQFNGEVLDAPTADSDRIRLREAYADRVLAGLTPEQQLDARAQAEAMGWDFATRECWVTKVDNDDGSESVVVVAKLEALQARVLASGKFNGRKGPIEFQGADGAWVSIWADPINRPIACRMTLCRHGVDGGYEVSGLWAEMKKDTWYWRERPTEALEKCVEAKALRKLYRDVLGNVYIPEELPGRDSGSRRRRGGGGSLPDVEEPTGPRLADYGANDDSGGGGDDDVNTERNARSAMTHMGVPEVAQTRLIAEARKNAGTMEDDNPSGFWAAVIGNAQRMVGGRRRSR